MIKGELYAPKSAGDEFLSLDCFLYANEPGNKDEIPCEKETRDSSFFFSHFFSSFENLKTKKKLFQANVHEML